MDPEKVKRPLEHESIKEESSISSKEKSEEKSKDSKKKKSLGQKIMASLKKLPIVIMAALFFAIGAPVGIALGILLLGFLARKPIFKMVKKGVNLLKRPKTTRKEIAKEKEIDKEIDKEISKRGRVTKTSTLEMDKQSLKSMGTRPDGVSVKKLPEDQSRATSNEAKLVNNYKFEHLKTPMVKLSKQALERRNSLPSREKSNPLTRRNSMPTNLKKPLPAVKM